MREKVHSRLPGSIFYDLMLVGYVRLVCGAGTRMYPCTQAHTGLQHTKVSKDTAYLVAGAAGASASSARFVLSTYVSRAVLA